MARPEEYILHLEKVKEKLEPKEEYEVCAEIQTLINSIKNNDVKTFIEIRFDIKSLTKEGFFKKGMTFEDMEQRIIDFFGYENIFEYNHTEICPYSEYAKGRYCFIPKVDF